MNGPILELDHVTRRFGPVVAVDDISLRFEPGVIHALVGENGAGKSTALKMAGGALGPSAGRVLVEGEPLVPATPAEATRRGIGFVHQHFMLVDAFSVLENVMLGDEPVRSLGRLDTVQAAERVMEVQQRLALDLDLHAPVRELGVGERQYLEILRVLVRGARALLLDEPTAVLTPDQAARLFELLRTLASDGATIVVVTHRLDEVMNFCDQVSVMRRGRLVLQLPVKDVSREKLTRAIMGDEEPPEVSRPDLDAKATTVLRVKNLGLDRGAGQAARLSDVQFEVRAGEIVGIAGVEGNGQQELVQVLTGLENQTSGEVWLGDQQLDGMSVRERMQLGMAVVQADRHREGLLLEASVWDNLVVGDLPLADEKATVRRRMERFDIRPPLPRIPVSALSGGNQQKVVVSRAMDREPKAVIMAQPTRGVDLGAAARIHQAIAQAARKGMAVLVVSADLAELRSVCHRILVLFRGRIVGEFSPQTDERTFGQAMLGMTSSEAPREEAPA